MLMPEWRLAAEVLRQAIEDARVTPWARSSLPSLMSMRRRTFAFGPRRRVGRISPASGVTQPEYVPDVFPALAQRSSTRAKAVPV